MALVVGSIARGRVPTRPQRRLTAWSVGVGGTTLLQLTATGKSIVGSGFDFSTTGTVVRTRGMLQLYLSLSTSAQDGYAGAFGIMLVRDQAFAAGAASIPGPLSDLNDEWLYHTFFNEHNPFASGGAVAAGDSMNNGAGTDKIVVDSKAMRKFTDGDTMVAMVEVVETGTATLNVRFNSRFLGKLH